VYLSSSRFHVVEHFPCSCGWGFQIHKQNALARAAQIRAAIRKHLREMQEAQEVNIKRNEFGRYIV